MKTITTNISNRYYKYQPGEFLPINIDGELANKTAFHMYKAKQALTSIKRLFLNTI